MHYASMGINPRHEAAVAIAPPYIDRRDIHASSVEESEIPILPVSANLGLNMQ